MHVFSRCTCSTKSLNKTHKKFLIISALKLASCELVVFRDMNTYMLKGRDFKTFLKENYAVALESYYMFIEHDADSAYGVCIY